MIDASDIAVSYAHPRASEVFVTFAEPGSLFCRGLYWRSTRICLPPRTIKEITMTDPDPQTTADFWDAYLSAADAWPMWCTCHRLPPGSPATHPAVA